MKLSSYWLENLKFGFHEDGTLALKHVGMLYIVYDL
jgi:hypothetical protein